MGYDRSLHHVVAEAHMPSTVNSQTPFKPMRWLAIAALVFGGIGYLAGSGAFGGNATTTGTPVCTTPARTTAPQR